MMLATRDDGMGACLHHPTHHSVPDLERPAILRKAEGQRIEELEARIRQLEAEIGLRDMRLLELELRIENARIQGEIDGIKKTTEIFTRVRGGAA